MTAVQQWHRKPPEPSSLDTITVAKYEPGKPLAGVIQVAKMALNGRVAVAYLPSMPQSPRVVVPDTPVLLAAWTGYQSPVRTQYVVVPPGQYLAFSEEYGTLTCEDEKGLTSWYELEFEVTKT